MMLPSSGHQPNDCGVAGNEQTDQLAKGAQTEQPNNPITYKEKVSIISAVTKPKQEADTVISAGQNRLCSGHNRHNSAVSNLSMWGGRPNYRPHLQDKTQDPRHYLEQVAKWPTDCISLICKLLIMGIQNQMLS